MFENASPSAWYLKRIYEMPLFVRYLSSFVHNILLDASLLRGVFVRLNGLQFVSRLQIEVFTALVCD